MGGLGVLLGGFDGGIHLAEGNHHEVGLGFAKLGDKGGMERSDGRSQRSLRLRRNPDLVGDLEPKAGGELVSFPTGILEGIDEFAGFRAKLYAVESDFRKHIVLLIG